jgi:hypothetical protein
MAKVRRLGEFRGSKYVEAYRDRPGVYPTIEAIRPGKPLVVCEGELDCLLVAQELADLDAGVITLGSASSKPDAPTLGKMLTAPVWYLAHDRDGAGDRAASGWCARAIRIRPPPPHKDWGELHDAGFNLIRYVWHRILATPRPWEELARDRWGDGVGDFAPGVVIDKPDRGRMLAALKARVDDPDERLAIMTEAKSFHPTRRCGMGSYRVAASEE